MNSCETNFLVKNDTWIGCWLFGKNFHSSSQVFAVIRRRMFSPLENFSLLKNFFLQIFPKGYGKPSYGSLEYFQIDLNRIKLKSDKKNFQGGALGPQVGASPWEDGDLWVGS